MTLTAGDVVFVYDGEHGTLRMQLTEWLLARSMWRDYVTGSTWSHRRLQR